MKADQVLEVNRRNTTLQAVKENIPRDKLRKEQRLLKSGECLANAVGLN